MKTSRRPAKRRATRIRLSALLAGMLMTSGLVFWLWGVNVQAASATVTFTFTRIVEVHCNEGTGEACPNDYYPKVDIGMQGLEDGKDALCCAHGRDVEVHNWVFTRTVETGDGLVPILVQLWDQDDLSADDLLDIAPDGGRSLNITLDLNTCTWRGSGASGVVDAQSSSAGTQTDSAKIYFVISTTAPLCRDSDGDGLLDAWEINGYDHNGDGVIDVDLPAMGANPYRKDLFLELDYMVGPGHDHMPNQNAVAAVVRAFANAPVANPDGTFGIQLHVDVGTAYGQGVIQVTGDGGVTGTYGNHGGGGEQIMEGGNEVIDFAAPGAPGRTSFFTLKSMDPIRDSIFRYGMFAHQTNARRAENDCTSGLARGTANMMVTLGGLREDGTSCWAPDAAGNSVGSENQQAGTLMHEFGHLLGLPHGGADGVNDKPNYLSVMNYAFQGCRVPSSPSLFVSPVIPGGCDFSRFRLPRPPGRLNENSLDECRGMDGGAFGYGPVDWNGDGVLQGASCTTPGMNVTANVNGDFNDLDGDGEQGDGEADIFGLLEGFDDWAAILYNHRMIYDFTVAGAITQHEPDPETIERSRTFLTNLLRPALSVSTSGPAFARPGDTIAYDVTLRNPGRGPALHVGFVDTLPDATTVTRAIGTVQVGGSASRSVPHTVACSVADGTVLTNAVTASGIDLLSNPLSDSDTARTTVQAPRLTLAKSATASVNAGEAITYTIEYENEGSGAASQVTITDVLPAGLYYSLALDQGDGPRPSAVTLNADGTRTLTWNLGTLAGASGVRQITFTARPTLLARGGQTFTNEATLSFTNENGCVYDALDASASTTITVLAPSLDPLTIGYWKTHPEEYLAEILARIQATDQRFDRAGADGALSPEEVVAAFAPNGMPHVLEQQLLATWFNLATRRLNAETVIVSRLARALGLRDVGEAAEYGIATLALPLTKATSDRYSDAATALDEINNGRSIR
jgi:uncharacterized repeat protein (TIGR01451 family)